MSGFSNLLADLGIVLCSFPSENAVPKLKAKQKKPKAFKVKLQSIVKMHTDSGRLWRLLTTASIYLLRREATLFNRYSFKKDIHPVSRRDRNYWTGPGGQTGASAGPLSTVELGAVWAGLGTRMYLEIHVWLKCL